MLPPFAGPAPTRPPPCQPASPLPCHPAPRQALLLTAARCCPALPLPSELLTGKGALAQLGYEVGLPTFQVDGVIAALVLFNLAAAFLPASGTFVPEEQEAIKATPKGAIQVLAALRPRLLLRALRPAPCARAPARVVGDAHRCCCCERGAAKQTGQGTRLTPATLLCPPVRFQNPKISLLNPKEFFGVSGFGFSKANE